MARYRQLTTKNETEAVDWKRELDGFVAAKNEVKAARRERWAKGVRPLRIQVLYAQGKRAEEERHARRYAQRAQAKRAEEERFLEEYLQALLAYAYD